MGSVPIRLVALLAASILVSVPALAAGDAFRPLEARELSAAHVGDVVGTFAGADEVKEHATRATVHVRVGDKAYTVEVTDGRVTSSVDGASGTPKVRIGVGSAAAMASIVNAYDPWNTGKLLVTADVAVISSDDLVIGAVVNPGLHKSQLKGVAPAAGDSFSWRGETVTLQAFENGEFVFNHSSGRYVVDKWGGVRGVLPGSPELHAGMKKLADVVKNATDKMNAAPNGSIPMCPYNDSSVCFGIKKSVDRLEGSGVKDIPHDHWARFDAVVATSPLRVNESKTEVVANAGEGIAAFVKLLGIAPRSDSVDEAITKAVQAGLMSERPEANAPMDAALLYKLGVQAFGFEPERGNPNPLDLSGASAAHGTLVFSAMYQLFAEGAGEEVNADATFTADDVLRLISRLGSGEGS